MDSQHKNPRKVEPWENGIVLAAAVIIAIIMAFATATSCSSKYCQWLCRSSHRDSTVVNNTDSLRIRDNLRIRDSLIYVTIPIEGSQNIFPAFIPSHLETSLAVSDAFVDSLGLHHSLRNKETDIGVHVPVTDHTTIIEHTTQKDSTSAKEDTPPPLIIEVEKPLPKWKQFQIDAFWWLFGSLVLSLIVIFRKPLWKLITRIIP